MAIVDLLAKIAQYNPDCDRKRIRAAYSLARTLYKGKKRLSNRTLLHHTTSAAKILTTLKADDDTIIACLLHHAKEEQFKKIEATCGQSVTQLIKSVQEFSKLREKTTDITNKENLRKVLLASVTDVRILFIKLSEKLHNMQTLKFTTKENQQKIAQECLDVYAPLAYRLGLGSLKQELQDLGFKYTEPEKYKQLLKSLKESKNTREKRLQDTLKKAKTALNKTKIKYTIFGRTKHLHSIQAKLEKNNYTVKDLYDLVALRIITKNVEDCYKALECIHKTFKNAQRTKDYIVKPKPNGYQSLHTTVKNEEAYVEFQIRTKEMDTVAEAGTAVHWGYKGIQHKDQKFDKQLTWLKQTIEGEAQVDFFAKHIFVFTPKGELLQLPKQATPIDFAYTIHSSIGDTCVGAQVNGKIAPLRNPLKNGDVVKIITRKDAQPSKSWLRFIKTLKAKQKIRSFMRKRGLTPQRAIARQQETTKDVRQQVLAIQGMKDPDIMFAPCCQPLPAEDIAAVKKGVNRVIIHKDICKGLKDAKKFITATWKESFEPPVHLYVQAEDRIGIFAEILNMVAAKNITVTGAKGSSFEKGVLLSFNMGVDNLKALLDIIKRIKKIRGVKKVRIGEL